MMSKVKYILFSFFIISALFSQSKSRIKTSIDLPSEYSLHKDFNNIDSESLQDQQYHLDIDGGASVSYEHMIFKKNKFKGFIGVEAMLGRDSYTSMAFHSIYFMPSIDLGEDIDLAIRIGYTNLNSGQTMPTKGFMFSIGPEINLSEFWDLHFSSTWYNIAEDMILAEDISGGLIDIGADGSNGEARLEYSKFGISLIYSLPNKIEKGKKK